MSLLYDNYIINLSTKVELAFKDIQAVHNFELGNEFEVAICQLLRTFLPTKYGICRGYVVSSEGEKKGDDIIIFDQERFPTLRLKNKEDYSTLEQIPIEAVYSYIEAKHMLTKDTFDKALQQVIEVKELCSKRKQMSLYQTDPYIISNLKLPYELENLPAHRNPIFTMILSRFCCGVDGKTKSEDPAQIEKFLTNQLNTWTIDTKFDFFPELIIGGAHNSMNTSFIKDGVTKATLFHLNKGNNSGYQIHIQNNYSFGIALAHLIAAIDWIRLGKMPWEDIINQTKGAQDLDMILNEAEIKDKRVLKNFKATDFVNGELIINHPIGALPQVSLLDSNGEEIITEINKQIDKIIIRVNGSGFDGTAIIS